MKSKKSREAAPPARDLRDGARSAHEKSKEDGFGPSSFFISSLYYNTSMPTVRFPAMMKYYLNNQAEFFVPASTVTELVGQVIEQYPSIKFHLVDAEGNLRRHFNVFINGTHIRELNGMDTRLNEGDKVILMASAAGG